jgi:hypothetical protein
MHMRGWQTDITFLQCVLINFEQGKNKGDDAKRFARSLLVFMNALHNKFDISFYYRIGKSSRCVVRENYYHIYFEVSTHLELSHSFCNLRSIGTLVGTSKTVAGLYRYRPARHRMGAKSHQSIHRLSGGIFHWNGCHGIGTKRKC